jgi:hypothetical protein
MKGHRPTSLGPLTPEQLVPPPGGMGIRSPSASPSEADRLIQENAYLKYMIECLTSKIKELEERVEVLISNAYDRQCLR